MKRFWTFYIPYFIFIIVLAALLISNEKADLHLFLATPHTVFCDMFFKVFTEIGGSFPFIAAGLLLFYKYRATLFIMVSGTLAAIVTHLGKWLYNAPRPKTFFAENFPDVVLPQVAGVNLHSWHSFPSGHSTAAFSFFLCLALMTENKILQFFYCITAILVAYSRIYLNQHFASDVLAGTIIGGFSATLCYIFIFNKYKMTWADGSLRDFWKIKK
ncbi:MAG: phosphatase PAP2 family protein [Prevotellaceae bacterium]|jgi:membrane-associated phospholipid phosphatase|nr:phosphatase PAP2 family protein [Prevotellaceae bacterium]